MHIAVSSWSFRHALYSGALQLADVPLKVFECGLRHVELNDLFLAPPQPGRLARWLGAKPLQTKSPDYGRQALMRVQQGRLRSGTRLACWTIETDLTAAGAEEQKAQRAYVATAIEAARFLGAPILRLTLGGAPGDRSSVRRAIDLLRGVLPVAMASGVRLAIENHGGLSSEAGVLEEVMGAFPFEGGSGARPIGACLDVRHFPEGRQVEGVTRLAPLAIHVHAPVTAFGANGDEVSIDYRASLAALRAAGYDAAVSVEYNGEGDPREAIRAAKALIERHWQAAP